MGINWRLRFLNRSWWMSFIPAALLCAQTLASCFGVKIDLGDKTDTILAAVNSIFVVLALMGVSSDPTTPGWNDSQRAMGYTEPGVTTHSEPVKREIGGEDA